MFDDEMNLIQLDELDILLEASGLMDEVSSLTDQRLVEITNELLLQFDFSKECDYYIGRFFSKGVLPKRGREILEGVYVLYYGTMALGVDNGNILLNSRQ